MSRAPRGKIIVDEEDDVPSGMGSSDEEEDNLSDEFSESDLGDENTPTEEYSDEPIYNV
jgi:hypothetical protein